ncbi:response regulator [Bdellovibrio sp. GT3]|uniref:response regulator n=1 Tax=Bdellovibrio sp. GT3 TaxID=3136282 RepID=UPI0030F12386
MNSVSLFKTLISRFGVELCLLVLVAVGSSMFQEHHSLQKALLPEGSVNSLQNMSGILHDVDRAKKDYFKDSTPEKLAVFNSQVTKINNELSNLYKSVNGRYDLQMQVYELNQNLHRQFETATLEIKQKHTARTPSNIEDFNQRKILELLQAHRKAQQDFVQIGGYNFLRSELMFAILGLFGVVILLSRYWQHKDLKAQRDIAENLQRRSLLLDTILGSMSEGMIVVNNQGHFTQYNAAAQRTVGTKVKEIGTEAGAGALGFHDENGKPYSSKDLPLHRALYGVEVDDLEIFVQNETHPEGTYILLSSRAIKDIDGGIAGALVVFRDISRRKQVEKEWAKAREAAVEASLKKSDFLAAMSHEIRTPMNGVIGMSTLLAETALEQEQKEYVGTIKRSAESLLMLINDILDYSKIEAGKISLDPQPFDLNFLVRDVVEMFRPALEEKNVELEFSISQRSNLYFNGDQGRIRQILVNLMGNAVKFTSAGTVGLEVSILDSATGPSLLKFQVRDTGMGLQEDERTALFQKYFQATAGKKFGGTGLGLSICKQLVDLMNGQMGVESTFGIGSTFWFSLQLPVCAAEDVPKLSTETQFDSLFKGRILVAEDQVINQRVAQNYLHKFGLQVDIAQNGRVAVEMARTGKYDLIFMDCQMPIMNGFDATKRIREEEQLRNSIRRIPIVALTAEGTIADKAPYTNAGMDDYLSKPIELPRMIETLQRYLKPGDPQVIDMAALQKLQKYASKDGSLLKALVEEFETSTPDLILSMRGPDFSSAAHALKSSAATLGAKILADLCQKLEDESKPEHINKWVIQIEAEFARSLQDLKNYISEKGAA